MDKEEWTKEAKRLAVLNIAIAELNSALYELEQLAKIIREELRQKIPETEQKSPSLNKGRGVGG